MRFGPSKWPAREVLIVLIPSHSSEKAVNDRLAQAPELYMLALAQSAAFTPTEVVRTRVLWQSTN